MSKIRDVKITTSLGGKYMGQYYETKMEYSPSGKVFFIRLPDDQKDFKADFEIENRLLNDAPLRGYTTIKAFTGNLEAEVEKKAQEYFNLFLKALRSERKVILYSIRYGSERKGGNIRRYGEDTNSELNVDFLVAQEVQLGLDVKYLVKKMETDPFRPGKKRETTRDRASLVEPNYGTYKIMEWTEEREGFFQNMMDTMDKMIEQIKAVVEEPETFITMIDQGKNLLTAGEVKK